MEAYDIIYFTGRSLMTCRKIFPTKKKYMGTPLYGVLARYTKCINLHTMSFYLTVPYNNRASLDFKSKFNLPKNIKWQAENRIG